MFGWLTQGGRTPGWLAVSFDETTVEFAHARRVRGPKAAQVSTYATRDLGADASIDRVKRDHKLSSYQCSTMLRPGEYDLLLVEAPNVPRAEMKSALRWKVKDMVDYAMDEATIDFLDIPAEEGAAGRAHQLYAVLARNEVIQARIQKFHDAGLALSVIDIPETAQRNIAALLEPAGRGLALLYIDRAQSLLTITCRGELYLARRIDLGLDHLEATDGPGDAHNRMLLELQRSFDHLDRQFPFAALAKVVLAPTPSETGLRAHLAENLDLPVEELRFADILKLDDGVLLDGEAGWRLFHVLGAALRHEAKAL